MTYKTISWCPGTYRKTNSSGNNKHSLKSSTVDIQLLSLVKMTMEGHFILMIIIVPRIASNFIIFWDMSCLSCMFLWQVCKELLKTNKPD